MSIFLWTRLLAASLYILCVCGEITRWTNPDIDGAQGSGPLFPYVLENRYGTTGIVVRAESGSIHYFIIFQPVKNMFAINETSGEITVATGVAELDTESGPGRYELVIWAKGDDFSEGTATATIFVADLNDNAPYFEYDIYEAEVRDNSEPGTVVTVVTATDVDALSPNNLTIYSITVFILVRHRASHLDPNCPSGAVSSGSSLFTEGNSNNTFKMDSTSGTITVRKGRSVQRTSIPGFNLTIMAVDQGRPPLSGTTLVVVVVSRANSADVVYISVILPVLIAVM